MPRKKGDWRAELGRQCCSCSSSIRSFAAAVEAQLVGLKAWHCLGAAALIKGLGEQTPYLP